MTASPDLAKEMDIIQVEEDDKSKEPVLTDDADGKDDPASKDDPDNKDDPDAKDDPDTKDDTDNKGKAANQPNLFSEKEIEGDANDPCEQIAFMVHGLSASQKRRTLSLLKPEFEPLLTSTVLGGKQDDVSPA